MIVPKPSGNDESECRYVPVATGDHEPPNGDRHGRERKADDGLRQQAYVRNDSIRSVYFI